MNRETSSTADRFPKADGDRPQRIRDWFSVSGMSGAFPGTSGKAFFYGLSAIAVLAAAVNAINVITIMHEHPDWGTLTPVVLEGSSCLTIVLFCWIAYAALRIAPLDSPRWWFTGSVHIAAAIVFSACHVYGFVAVRKFAYWLEGRSYDFGGIAPFGYEFRKDIFGYVLFVAIFLIAARLVAQPQAQAIAEDNFYIIRDGARLNRVRLDEVLAICSAGNYVEFAMRDGRRILMRSPLSALENELDAKGFVRTHRSWLVNAGAMTALKPDGSGDYTIALGSMQAPLSRRFPQALAKLRGG